MKLRKSSKVKAKNGKTRKENMGLVKQFFENNKGASHRQCAESIGISPASVSDYVLFLKEVQI